MMTTTQTQRVLATESGMAGEPAAVESSTPPQRQATLHFWQQHSSGWAVDVLKGDGPFTVFAPNDAAVTAALESLAPLLTNSSHVTTYNRSHFTTYLVASVALATLRNSGCVNRCHSWRDGPTYQLLLRQAMMA